MMVKRLKKRFLAITMLSVFIVLLILNVAVNTLNYKKMIDDCDSDLSVLNEFSNIENTIYMTQGTELSETGTSGTFFAGNIFVEGLERMHVSVQLDKDMKIENVWSNVIGLSSTNIVELAQRAIGSGKETGFVDNYRFIVRETWNGGWYVSFVDVSESLHSFKNFLMISTSVSLACMVVLSVILYFVSDKAIRPIVESYEKQKRFITDAGHELKTPLTIIRADSDALEMEIGEDNEWVSDIKKQTVRMNELTNNLILLSKMEETNLARVSEPVELGEVVEDQAGSFRAVAESCDINMNIDADDITVKGDKKMLSQLVSILADNAVKYCPEHKSIDISLKSDQKNAIMEITNDTKEDIKNDSLKHLFDRFYRTDSSHNSSTGGHGIGLSIAKAITDSHKGKITAEKRRDYSITFKVILPLEQ